jgi:hypothetical protein
MSQFNTIKTVFILLSTTLFASDTFDIEPTKESQWHYFGDFQSYITQIDRTTERSDLNNPHEVYNLNALQLNLSYENDGFFFNATPYAYFYKTESDEKVFNNNIGSFDKEAIFFRTLYASYTIGDTTYGAGLLPFSNSFPMQYKTDYLQDGEGLSIISDLEPLAAFMIHYFSDTHRMLLGIGMIDTTIIPAGDYVNENMIDKTYGLFLTQTLTYDTIQIINDIKYSQMYYEKKHGGDLFSAGTGIAWDDAEYSGWSIYNLFAISYYKNNSTNIKNEMLSDMPQVTPGVLNKFSSSFHFDDQTYKGAANLIGVRKDFDLFGIDTFLTAEWFHTFDDWESVNKGSIYQANTKYISNIRDNAYYITLGLRLWDASMFRINYTRMEFDEVVNVGAPNSTPVKAAFGKQISKTQLLQFSYSYRF